MPSTATDRLAGLTTSVAVKPPCHAATTAAITLSGLQTVDGVTLAAGDRVLVKDQSDAVANGIYVAAAGTWPRALDFNGSLDAVGGTQFRINEGSSNADTYWRVSGDGPVIIATDEIEFEPDILATSASLGFIQAGTGAVATALQTDLRAKGLYPNQWNAIGNGVADDTAELQSLFTAASVAAVPEVHLTGGRTYLVTGPGTDEVILTITRGIRLIGNGATIKVANGSTGFHAIIGSQNPAVDLSGLWIEGVTFDHNGQNEAVPPTITDSLLDLPRYTVKAKRGSGLTFVNCDVLNSISTNCIVFNGDGNTSDTVVRGCRFYLCQTNLAGYFDHSTIYNTGDNIEVSDSYFHNGLGSANGTCAIEIHPGNQYVVQGNRIYGYHTAINIVGIYEADSRAGVVTGNTSETLRRGIVLYTNTYLTHVTGYGLDGLIIDDNYVRIRNQLSWTFLPGGGGGCFAIAIVSGAGLKSRDITIGAGNQVVFDLETTTPDWDSVPAGVGVGDSTGSIVHENFYIGALTIENSPVIGVLLGSGGGVLHNLRVDRTRIIRAGSTAKSMPGSDDSRCGIWMNPAGITGSLIIEGVEIIDDLATTKLVNGMVTQSAAVVTVPVNISADIMITGTTTTAYGKAIYKVNNNIVPLARVSQNIAPIIFDTGDSFRIGSTTHLRTTGVTAQMLTDAGTAFTRVTTYGVLTVATLPAAATAGAGAEAFVSDANATTFASVVVGGGANNVPVYSDATNWRIG